MPSLTPSMYVRICFGAWLQIWANIMELGVRAETGGPQRQTGGLVRGLNVDTARWNVLGTVHSGEPGCHPWSPVRFKAVSGGRGLLSLVTPFIPPT